jgi:hypothetical protein
MNVYIRHEYMVVRESNAKDNKKSTNRLRGIAKAGEGCCPFGDWECVVW